MGRLTVGLFDPRTGASWQETTSTPPVRAPRRRAPEDPSITERFEMFHVKHPEVYERLVALCRHARSRGRRRIGIGMLWEVLRWERILDGLPDPGEDRKLNDHYRSRYARLIMEREPDLKGIFETRALRSR